MAAAIFVGTLSGAASVAPPVHVIGVDNASPSGHNFSYVDFFPHSATTVHLGDIIDFAWNAGSLDGFHTATLLKPGQSVAAGYAAPDGLCAGRDRDARSRRAWHRPSPATDRVHPGAKPRR